MIQHIFITQVGTRAGQHRAGQGRAEQGKVAPPPAPAITSARAPLYRTVVTSCGFPGPPSPVPP